MTDFQETIQQKRLQAQTEASAQQSMDSVIGQLKEIQLASLMGNAKSQVLLADSSDFGEKIDGLAKKLDEVIGKHTDSFTKASEKDRQTISKLISDIKTSLPTLKAKPQDNSDIVKAINALGKLINPKPEVTVNAPDVKVTSPAVDLKPIVKAIQNWKAPDIIMPEQADKFDMDDYKAHDLTDGTDKQYVGFMNPEGNWYIIENDMKANSLRYLFGSGNYEKAFAKASTYQYETLDEALHAV